ncbi:MULTISPECIES: LysR family transcriptional regulator [Pseudoalteromonas]|uniref:LysR family transcriptional regulator n=1 Tax=Pseudoalteromonas arctica TaxID=394751 RepID=A0AAP6Y1T2_9GAMM|nr:MULTISPECIES: LysR family transcriptional regulator [Pseudoalteromonas]MBH0001300.1 LysR family transcriptional regulator [Pseudoalteromonas sp. SWYJZ12]MBH0047385.1 LysR family transcriptional regulator [Pseudoalteromonas sp. NZS11_1]NMP02325.1 LysR family transcriptional regulator [Pseudoalteromonas arctica]
MDKLTTMKTFLAVVQEGSFSKAADKLDISPQLVSKYISALEDNLRTRLLHRTTRKVSVTEAGNQYYQRCQQVVIDIEDMENSLNNLSENVSGVLSISAPMSFGTKHLAGLLVDFQKQYPNLKLDLRLTDQYVDIVEQGIDIALRIGVLKNSTLIAKKIAPIHLAVFASPDYLERHGTPQTLLDLQSHNYLRYSHSEPTKRLFGVNELKSELKLESNFVANNGDLLLNTAIAGGGIAMQPTFIAGEALAQGKVVRILKDYEPEPMGLYMVYANRQFLPSKVRAFVDFTSGYYGDVPYWDLA